MSARFCDCCPACRELHAQEMREAEAALAAAQERVKVLESALKAGLCDSPGTLFGNMHCITAAAKLLVNHPEDPNLHPEKRGEDILRYVAEVMPVLSMLSESILDAQQITNSNTEPADAGSGIFDPEFSRRNSKMVAKLPSWAKGSPTNTRKNGPTDAQRNCPKCGLGYEPLYAAERFCHRCQYRAGEGS